MPHIAIDDPDGTLAMLRESVVALAAGEDLSGSLTSDLARTLENRTGLIHELASFAAGALRGLILFGLYARCARGNHELRGEVGGAHPLELDADREQVLDIARNWIVASGKQHPMQLPLTGPEQRLALADLAIKSIKQALTLYGLDADGVLASVRIEQLSRDGDHAKVRTSFELLDVPLVFEEDLTWFEGHWEDTETVTATKAERANPPVESDEWSDDPMVPAPEAESMTHTGCDAPVDV